ncbi:MAG: SDR family NAD(P)-dependent oxidoreductase [Planctomycetes bacterium]|nr:SDR family NAD(P)-dependent oxidoreductase [Planctomycetota bacterium]
MTRAPAAILITGASAGLGRALALGYAAPGATLFLGALDAEPLQAVAAACRAQGAVVIERVLDVRDRAAMADWIATCDDTVALDLVIANAGISASGLGADGEDDATTRAIFATNVDGVLNTVLPAIAAMRARSRGQLALVSSLAGYRGSRRSAAYCASKAAVRVFGEGLRARLAPAGIGVSVVCPGYLDVGSTSMRHRNSPLRVGVARAVRAIRRGLARNRGWIAVPWWLSLVARVGSLLPSRCWDWIGRLSDAKARSRGADAGSPGRDLR